MVSLQTVHSFSNDTVQKPKMRNTRNPSVQKKDDPDLLTRTSYVNARIALVQIKKGKATGNKAALWIRSKLQDEFFKLGCVLQNHAGKVLFVGLLVLATLTIGLKNAEIESRVERLWIEEGGRLEKELEYLSNTLGEGSGATNQLLIQTPAEDGRLTSVLSAEALLTHLEVMKSATRVVVEMDDTVWKLKDLCHAQTIPPTEIHMINQIIENLVPCSIITPLDCFWEGSKLLSPDYPVHVPLGGDDGSITVSWTSLNPANLVQSMASFKNYFNFKNFEKFMKQAGITTGYQEKPCLNPFDPDCPSTAPNKDQHTVPDIGAELSGGCYGFATRYMHWPEQLIVGGTTKNKTGHITRAKGLQSIVQLMGEKDLYDYYSNTYMVHNLDWSVEKAAEILKEWQDKFSQEVAHVVKQKNLKKTFDINAFSTSHLDAIMEQFSEVNFSKIAMSYFFMVVYAGFTLFRWSDVVRSQASVGITGVFLVTFTVSGGLGICALLGLTFNASTTQIVPFLALGLGVDAMFIMVHTYSEMMAQGYVVEDHIGEVLRRSGTSVLLTSICNVAAFLAAAIIPVPALRSFAFQAAILIASNMISMVFLFPALLGLDLRRVASGKIDLVCCYKQPNKQNEKKKDVHKERPESSHRTKYSHDEDSESPGPHGMATEAGVRSQDQIFDMSPTNWSLTWFATTYYGYWITKAPFRVMTLFVCVLLTSAGIWGMTKVTDGLDLTDVVPRDTSVYRFLRAQGEYFGFYNIYAVTQSNFEYPQNQKLLYDYHNAFVRVPHIVKDDNGGLPEFWLSLFRNWLDQLQTAFDDDLAAGNIHEKGWHENASSDAVLAFKLMVQTGHVDYPVDMTLLTKNRLVDSHGVINPSAFYNYLSAWCSNDAMAYSFSQASLVPVPKEWLHDPRDHGLRIPKSQPIVLARIPFYLNNLRDTEITVETIRQIRQICQKFEEKGLPNFPSGIPFTFWEQYLHLRSWISVGLVCILAAVFLAISLLMMNPWIAAIIVVVIATIVVQLFGAMGILGIKLSAVPAIIVIVAVGLGVEFTAHICMGFLTSIGSRQRRVMMSLHQMFAPVFHGAFSTFLGIIMLAFSHFDFVVRYFFFVLTALIILGLFNGLVFLPVLLVMLGPPGEVIPNDRGDAIAPPSPEFQPSSLGRQRSLRTSNRPYPSIRMRQSQGQGQSQGQPPQMTQLTNSKRHNSDLSLSTIAEESNSYSSSSHSFCCPNKTPECSRRCPAAQLSSINGASVIVEPHVTVETTTYGDQGIGTSDPNTSCHNPMGQVTKVTATAKFKVEVHAPSMTASLDRPSSSRSRGRRSCSRSTVAAADANPHVTPPGSGHSSLSSSLANSVSSSLSSNEGDLGFSEK